MMKTPYLALLLVVPSSIWAQPHGEIDFGLIAWLTSHPDGIFNPKQEVRYDDDDAQSSHYHHYHQFRLGIFAKEFIPRGELLTQIPIAMLVGPDMNAEIDEDEEFFCDLVEIVVKEMTKGCESNFAPYMNYLQDIIDNGPTIPSAWSDVGKALFQEILGAGPHSNHQNNDQDLPPGQAISLLDSVWFVDCGGIKELQDIAGVVLQKATGDFLIPVYDLYTHRNEPYYNIDAEYDEENGIFVVSARRDIQPGEQLHTSYDKCDECDPELEKNGFGTPEIFRDYGVIPDYPQSFSFQPDAVEIDDGEEAFWYNPNSAIQFQLIQQQQQETDGATPTLSIQWADHLKFDDTGRNYVRRVFRTELRRLYRLQNVLYNLKPSSKNNKTQAQFGIPQHEWDGIVKFYETTKTALQYAIHSLVNTNTVNETTSTITTATTPTCGEGKSSNEGYCSADAIDLYEIHYDDLNDEEDYINYIFAGCETTQLVEFWDYQDVEIRQTNYQQLSFVQRPKDSDMCMNLESTLQICASYRPHYHEFFVHYPARYIDKIQRVIFIGGGDSMLLHEVLKYDSLEKVVGLELDQQVTRKSFQYFHSQPHYDNDKVEWWYGDATKSLPLLPKDYWGSFDLVLVDLSETVMSMSVTQGLDIFGALSLLLKPEGIMVKNEPYYLDQFSQFFDHSIHIFYGTPKICTQVLVMGSNKVDFLHQPVKEHPEVERFLLEPLEEDLVRFKYMHDFVKSNARKQGKCGTEDSYTVSVKHGQKAGILEIIDAENITFDLASGLLESLVVAIIEQQGLSLVSKEQPTTSPHADGNGTTYVFVIEEGYIVIRAFPEKRYCAMDVNLWGSFQKQERIRLALADALGSRLVSSFRIVVGGMHGTSTWEEDKEAIGIQVRQTRSCEDEDQLLESDQEENSLEGDSNMVELAATALDAALAGLVDTFVVGGDEDDNEVEAAIAVVACGINNIDACDSFTALSANNRISKVVPIWTCPDLNESVTYTSDFDAMYKCEKLIQQQMEETFGGSVDGEAHLFVLDTSARYSMAQIFQSIWAAPLNREEWLTAKHVFVTPMLDASESKWRLNFMERYRKEKHPFPVSRAEMEITVYGSSSGLLHLGFFVSNDRYFFNRLAAFETSLRESLSNQNDKIRVEAPTIRGGKNYFDEEYNDKAFDPAIYDSTPAMEQASTQMSLGRQSVFQLEAPADGHAADAPDFDFVASSLQKTFPKLEYLPAKLARYPNIGEDGGGVVVTTFADGGVIVLVFDGKTHVDINLFARDESEDRATKFVQTFARISGLQRTLRDDQPRGTGRVVQFQSDMAKDT